MLPVVSSELQKCHLQILSALDALKAAEVPALLQTCSDASQLLPEGAGQSGKESLHLAGVNLQTQRHNKATCQGLSGMLSVKCDSFV